MSERVVYQGELTDSGVQPCLVGVGEGVHAKAVELLKQIPGVKVTENLSEACVLIVRTKTRLNTPEDITRNAREAMYVAFAARDPSHISNAAPLVYNNITDAHAEAVADRAFALIQVHCQRISSDTAALKQWATTGIGHQKSKPIGPSELRVGIVGFGQVGHALAEQLSNARGQSSIACSDIDDRTLSQDNRTLQSGQVVSFANDIAQLMEESNVISIHVPGLRDGTPNLVLTSEVLQHARPGTLIVNTSRGSVVDKKALLEAMDRGVLYATDVLDLEIEQTGKWDDLSRAIVLHPNFVAGTTHTGSTEDETQEAIARQAVESAVTAVITGALPHPINLDLPGMREMKKPGYRLVYSHRTPKGTLRKITEILERLGFSTEGAISRDGDHFAMSIFEIEGDADAVLRAHKAILDLEDDMGTKLIHRGRVSVFQTKSSHQSDAI